ncbi:sigma-70 family RNA polymerase sigma factor [Phenylobacterium sp.]|jgi:RNA polymerase sigma-70 factor (ECF subfamily)|uniref:sigma-70 family RNA polymerase sigma factor n=1 Tax=Phenylobacterium sp. TaxID=1871053 RepID=UPI002F957C2C
MSDPLLAEMVQLLPKLRAYALVLTRCVSAADDLVQDALLRGWRFREGYTPGTNLKAWLFRILRNEFLSQAQTRRLLVEDPDGRLAAGLATEPCQEFNLRYKELLAGLELLSADTRDAVVLTLAAGFTYAEVAELCGCRIGTVKSRVNRGRELLIRHLEPATPIRAAGKQRAPDPTRRSSRGPGRKAENQWASYRQVEGSG